MRLMLICDRWSLLNLQFAVTWFLIVFSGLCPPAFVDNLPLIGNSTTFRGKKEGKHGILTDNEKGNEGTSSLFRNGLSNIDTRRRTEPNTKRPRNRLSKITKPSLDLHAPMIQDLSYTRSDSLFYKQNREPSVIPGFHRNNVNFKNNSRQKFDRIFGHRSRRKHQTLNRKQSDLFVNKLVASSSWAVRIPVQSYAETFSKSVNKTDLHFKASRIALSAGLINHGPIGGLLGHYYFVHDTFYTHGLNGDNSEDLKQIMDRVTSLLENHPEIEWVRHEKIRMRYKRTLEFKDQFFPSQWHLDNLKFVGHDINVTGVWEHNITGRGVVVSVIDDGVEWTNPDILDNYSPEGSWDLNSNDGDPMPRVDEAGLNHHGTRCAGEIAAVANEYCAVGVAYGASVSGVRILDGPMTDSLEAMAFNTKLEVNDIYSCSWGPDDNGKTVDGPHQLAQAALAHGVMAGRQGYGSIFVVASGNGGHFQDNCNFDGYANSIFTVTIGAVDELGQMPYYAEHCAAMLAVTYSSGQGHQRNIVTTDWRLGSGTGCTDRHTGTSAAAPLAAGMIALMLEVRNCMTWRDVQHIMVFTAVKVSIDEDEWHTNGAGFPHSHKHGFGLLNSWRLVMTSKLWPNVPYLTSWSTPVLRVHEKIPLSGEVIKTYTVDHTMADEVVTIEHVTVTVNIKHSCRGSLAINLISPAGTLSKLATARKYDRSSEGLVDWTFSTVRCWGERPHGRWKIVVSDSGDADSPGTLKDWRLTFYGSSMTLKEIHERKRLLSKRVDILTTPVFDIPLFSSDVINLFENLYKVSYQDSSSSSYFAVERAAKTLHRMPPCTPAPKSPGLGYRLSFHRLVKRAVGGKYFHQPGPPCPPPPSPFIQDDVLSPRILKILLLLSGFVFLLGIYFLLETVCDNSNRVTTVKESKSATQSPDNGDLAPFLPKELAEEDKIRLTQLLEQGSLKLCSDTSFQNDSIILTPDSLPKTPDEMTRFKEFEERLKKAMDQSIALQTQQMNQIKNLERELADVNNIEGLGPADVVTEKVDESGKAKKKLKGILKKPKQYKE